MTLLLAALAAAAQPAPESSAPAVVPARVDTGHVSDRDYPRRANRERRGGHTITRLLVTARGRVGECQVSQSSGHADLDHQSCVIARRFRFIPARDAAGRQTQQWFTFPIWWTPPRNIRVETPKPEGLR